MRGRLTSNHLVGRVAELAELELAVSQAVTGRPALVLLGGESGVGKTRLLNEFEHRLHGTEPRPRVLRGEAVQTADSELPYGPLLSALRPLVRERHDVLGELTPGSRAQLAALLPGLDDGRMRSDRDDPSAQIRLFEALLELLDCLSASTPVVLVFEDVHWADRSTRAFLVYLARSLRSERVAVVLSYRSDELHRRHPLRPLLTELERVERTRRLQLIPFDRDELSEALTDILGERPSADLIDRLHARAEGNPLFTEELLAASLDGRGAAPESLRDAFMVRIERLSAGAQRAARVIAVGRALPEPVIAAVSGLPLAELQDTLREAVAAQILVPRGEDCLSFRHELLREALYDDLLPGERADLHLALARTLEERADASSERDIELVAGIAGHYASGGDQPAALRASVRAARAALAVHAPGESARHTERALGLWGRVAAPEQVAAISHVDLALLAARAQVSAGSYTRAEHLLNATLERLGDGADPRQKASVLAVLARVQWALNGGPQGVETARHALSLLPEGDVSQERVELLGWLARRKHLRGRFREAITDGEEALAAARAIGDESSEAQALNTLGMAEMTLGQVDSGMARLRHGITICERNDDLDGVAYVYANLADMLALAGRAGEGLEVARTGLSRVPRRLRTSHDWIVMTVSEIALLTGDWNEARANLGPPASELVGTRLIFRLIREAELALAEGDDEIADGALAQAAPLVANSTEAQWIGALGALLGEVHRRRRDLAAARAAVAQALDRIELCTDDVMRIARVTATGLRVEADIAQRARDLAERQEARDAVARARLHMQRLRAAAAEGGPVEAAWQATGAAELARARGRLDESLWTKAATAWHAIERPYEEALARWQAGEAAALAGDRARASEHVREALATARRLGSRWLTDELTGLALRARLDLEEIVAAGVETPEDPYGLTVREREVLALIARGATNRQIGAALFMAEKTASVHVSRILAKLGVHSRTEAAAVAHRGGWLSRDLVAGRPR